MKFKSTTATTSSAIDNISSLNFFLEKKEVALLKQAMCAGVPVHIAKDLYQLVGQAMTETLRRSKVIMNPGGLAFSIMKYQIIGWRKERDETLNRTILIDAIDEGDRCYNRVMLELSNTQEVSHVDELLRRLTPEFLSKHLSPIHARVITMYMFEGIRLVEIASMLELKEATVRKHKQRAIEDLRKVLLN